MKESMAISIMNGIEKILDRLCSGFHSKYIAEEDTDGTVEACYYVANEHMLGWVRSSGNDIEFGVDVRKVTILKGTYSRLTSQPQLNIRESRFYRDLSRFDFFDLADRLKVILAHIFSKYSEDLNAPLDLLYLIEQGLHMPINYTSAGMVQVLNQAFDTYIHGDHRKQGGWKSFATEHGHIRASFRYAENQGRHTSIRIRIVLVGVRVQKHLYLGDFYFKTGELKTVAGEKPDGFDEGFAHFKLVGQLTV